VSHATSNAVAGGGMSRSPGRERLELRRAQATLPARRQRLDSLEDLAAHRPQEPGEPPRVSWRLRLVRGWSHDTTRQVSARAGTSSPFLAGIALSVFIISYAFVFVLYFSSDVFPRIPEQFGGGRPYPAWLIVGDNVATQLTSLGVSVNGSRLTETVSLLFHGSSFYVIGIHAKGDDSATIVLRSDQILGVIAGDRSSQEA
jgi:hypothetical protein